MPFGADVLHSLETALAEGFEYHAALDGFLLRAGTDRAILARYRERAEERARTSPRGFPKASKRHVVQELLNDLPTLGDAGDRLAANLIDAVLRGNFPDATPRAKEAIAHLRAIREADVTQKREQERERREEQRRQEEAATATQARRLEEVQKTREALRRRFLELAQHPDPQRRGYLLQDFLNDWFDFEGLDPRRSFKLIGEQIDGSFAWASRTHLVEAKWVSAPVAGAEFGAFIYKLAGKSADTRGLYVSVNGYSREAREGLEKKGELRFVCIDGAHVARCFDIPGGLPRMLEALFRHLAETGEAYLPVGMLAV